MWFWNLLLDPLMRFGSIEVLAKGIERPLELLLMRNEQMIEALAPLASEKPFTGHKEVANTGVNTAPELLERDRWVTLERQVGTSSDD